MTLRVLREGAQLILRQPGAQPAEGLAPFGAIERPSASLMFVPVRHGDRTAGILSIQSYTPNAYDESDLAALQALGDYCGGALERLRVEEALRESEAQLARTEAFALTMTTHVGLDGTWLKVPPTLADLVGYAASELLGRSTFRITHPDDVEAEQAQCRRLVLGEARSFELEKRFIRRDGVVVWAFLNCSIVQDTAGRPLYFLTYIRDITERKSLEEQLRQAQKMEAVGQLAGGVAHDFNNLLTAIIGFNGMLLAQTEPTDQRHYDALEVERAAHRAAALTRQLLAFSRKQVLQPRPLNLNGVVTDLSGMLRRVIAEHVELHLELDSELGPVLADAGQLEQVITNLSVNARDAMPDGGTLTIRTANVDGKELPPDSDGPLHGSLVSLTVSDDGVGMDERTRARLFEPFFTTKELGRGTGLGLATVYGIVRQSGGRIRVETRLNEGSSFTVYLPRLEEPAADDAGAGAAPEAPGGHETVLLVEDEAAVRALTSRVLRGKGYRVHEADGAAHAMALLETLTQAPDLLITDIVMPGLGGPALAERLCSLMPGLRVLFITGYAEHAIAHHSTLRTHGMLLEKPFASDALAHMVRKVLAAPPPRALPS
jgi:two-component system, cell cycle sensor histidine kinase and response regulator CckA